MKKKKYNTTIPKYITFSFKILQTVSDKATVNLAKRLFITPIKYKIPEREIFMFENSKIEDLHIPKINKTIKVYHYGNQLSNNKILLVHGWSGRGTQLVKIANNFKDNYHIISFDAPAHGLSSGKTTMMLEFVESIIEIKKKHGNLKYAIGHSLGGMAILNSINKQVHFDKIVLIGSGNSIKNIIK
ncbi:MAG: alpha/beta hydrolase, partial [Flavobacteriaceae bacterium]|nr:alpha/beta hydrolase [Flavobacteriaceae bacterium]